MKFRKSVKSWGVLLWLEVKQPLGIALPLTTVQRTASPAFGEESADARMVEDYGSKLTISGTSAKSVTYVEC